MAKRVITSTEYTDDIDGTNAAGTVTFGFEGTNYEIDLSKANARALEKALKPYVDAGRKVRGTRGRPGGRRTNGKANGKRDISAIRAWARSNGFDVSDRGRIAAEVVDAYSAAN